MPKKRKQKSKAKKIEGNNLTNIPLGAVLVVGVIIVILLLVNYFKASSPGTGAGTIAQKEEGKQELKFRDISELMDDDPVKGDENAPVTIVEFSDFQCPFCKRFFDTTLPLIEENYIKTGKVKLVYRDFPLSFHQYALKAAEAAECANEQGKFWEYHNTLFEKQNEWASQGEQKFIDYASQLGLDVNKFTECLQSEKYKDEVTKDYNDGIKIGVQGTPTFVINGVVIVGAQPYNVFQTVIDQALAAAQG